MKQAIKFFAISVVIFTMASCSKDDDKKPDPNVVFETTLSGAKEVPANTSMYKGTAKLTFNKDTKTFVIKVTHDVAMATAGHIHMAAVGMNGAVIFPFGTTLNSPISYTSPVLTEEQITALNSGLFYVNIHTVAFPGGEIRGNLVKK